MSSGEEEDGEQIFIKLIYNRLEKKNKGSW